MDILKKKVVYNGMGLPICEKIEDIYTIDSPDYWTRLEHQYAGIAMQGLLQNEAYCHYEEDRLACYASLYAHALVEKLKEKEE